MTQAILDLLFSGDFTNYNLALQLAESQGFDSNSTLEALRQCEAYYSRSKRRGLPALAPFDFIVYLQKQGFKLFRASPEVEQHLAVLAPFVKNIDLRMAHFPRMPKVLQQFQQLELLSMVDTSLEEIPDWLWRLPRLFSLSLSANCYNEIKESIANSLSLKHLRLGSMQHIRLPKALPQLPFLSVFEYWTPPLTPVPDLIFDCPNLEFLGLGGVVTAQAAERLAQLQQLQGLTLVNTGWEQLPASLAKLPHLYRLSLARMPLLSAFPPLLYDVPNLEVLEWWLSPDLLLAEGKNLANFKQLKEIYIYKDVSTNALFTEKMRDDLEKLFEEQLPLVKVYIS